MLSACCCGWWTGLGLVRMQLSCLFRSQDKPKNWNFLAIFINEIMIYLTVIDLWQNYLIIIWLTQWVTTIVFSRFMICHLLEQQTPPDKMCKYVNHLYEKSTIKTNYSTSNLDISQLSKIKVSFSFHPNNSQFHFHNMLSKIFNICNSRSSSNSSFSMACRKCSVTTWRRNYMSWSIVRPGQG